MSIIPAGKRREQVAQGPLKNQSILESDLFKRFGQTAGALVDDPVQKKRVPDDLQQATMQGGVGGGIGADQQERDRNPQGAPNQQPDIAPAGGGMPGMDGMSPFLSQNLDQQQPQEQQSIGSVDIVNWVENIVQGNGFIVNVDKSQNRTRVTILPDPDDPRMPSFNWQGWKKILDRFKELGIETPTIEYKGNSASFTLDEGNGGKQVQKR